MSWYKILNHFKLTHLLRNVFYRLDWRKPNSSNVKDFLNEQVYSDVKLPSFKGTNDEKMIKILKWVKLNITYMVDSDRFNTPEKWQTTKETLGWKTGDCEDGAILMYCIAVNNKINPANLQLVAGDVTGGGHCWLEYAPDSKYDYENQKQIWYTMDWCYWYQAGDFDNRIAKSDNYIRNWWEVSHFKE